MTIVQDAPEASARIDDVAVFWFVRRRAGDLTTEEARALDAWLDDDPAHRAAFDAVEFTWEGIDPIASDPRIAALRGAAERRRRQAGAWRVRAAAAVLLAAVLAGGLGVYRLAADRSVLATQDFRTGVGEKAIITLSDGSVVTLGTDTRLRTQSDEGRRLVFLERGQAFFKVAKDQGRPFVVHAAGRTVTALGTAFEVRIDGGFKVTLVEGRVKINALAPPPARPAKGVEAPPAAALEETVLVAGVQLVALDAQHWSVTRTDVNRETAWVHGQLVYVDEPLGRVAAEMNRYSDRKIVVADGRTAAIPISGTFKAGDVEAFVQAIEEYDLVRVSSDAPLTVRLAAAGWAGK
jgi:transmembrane sensor